MPGKQYTIVIPVYNEAPSLQATYEQIRAFGQVIFVDDGSTDASGRILLELGLKDKNIKVLRHGCQKGYGAALKTGIRNADFDLIVLTDADLTYPNRRIPEFVNILNDEHCDMVVGARTGAHVSIPLVRRPAKWLILRLANFLTGTRILDINSGFRIIRKDAILRFMRFLPNGFSFTSTITIAMLCNDYAVRYVPIDYFRRTGRSKIRPIRDTASFLRLIITTTMYFKPLKIFVPLSFSLVLLAFMVGIGGVIFFKKVFDITFGIIIMTAVIVLAIGLLADLIDKRIG